MYKEEEKEKRKREKKREKIASHHSDRWFSRTGVYQHPRALYLPRFLFYTD